MDYFLRGFRFTTLAIISVMDPRKKNKGGSRGNEMKEKVVSCDHTHSFMDWNMIASA